jgi:hypothetical protein
LLFRASPFVDPEGPGDVLEVSTGAAIAIDTADGIAAPVDIAEFETAAIIPIDALDGIAAPVNGAADVPCNAPIYIGNEAMQIGRII